MGVHGAVKSRLITSDDCQHIHIFFPRQPTAYGLIPFDIARCVHTFHGVIVLQYPAHLRPMPACCSRSDINAVRMYANAHCVLPPIQSFPYYVLHRSTTKLRRRQQSRLSRNYAFASGRTTMGGVCRLQMAIARFVVLHRDLVQSTSSPIWPAIWRPPRQQAKASAVP